MHIREFFYMDKNQRIVLTVLLAVALVCVVLINLLGQGSLSDDDLLASPAAEEALGTDGTAARIYEKAGFAPAARFSAMEKNLTETDGI